MMKSIFTLLVVCSTFPFYGQITINSTHLPNAQDSLKSLNATLTGNVDLEATGANYTWNFGSDILQVQGGAQSTYCYGLSDLSFFDQLVFNNPLYPEYDSDFGQGAPTVDITVVQLEDVYQIYKNSGNVYGVTGVVATVNGVPAIAQMNDVDVIYNLPLTYNTSGNSHSLLNFEVPTIGSYSLDQTRSYACDGWGTIQILGESFNVLRVRSVVNASDSIYTSFLGNGIAFDRPEAITYEWLSTSFNVPILRVTTNLGQITQVKIADFLPVAVDELSSNTRIIAYPNPSENGLVQLMNAKPSSVYQVMNTAGQIVDSGTLQSGRIDLSNKPAGLYIVQVEDMNGLKS
ncbi:MAG: T9SS type A sorting domain-containing protein, partial [Flavobacteriales bacterium]